MSNIYKEGINRETLHLPVLDIYIGENNIARAIDAYVETLDMVKLNFTNSNLTVKDGAPAYHPKLLLKIYIYGYLHKIRSSRNIEWEICKNVELIWLTQGLTPKFKTIANFRKDNLEPLQEIFKEFVQLIKNIDLIGGILAVVDGAYLRANASKNQTITKDGVTKNLQRVDKNIEKYLLSLETTDEAEIKYMKLQEEIEKLKNKKERSKEEQEKLNKSVVELKNREAESNKKHIELKKNIEKLNNKKDKSEEEQEKLQKSISELKNKEDEANKKIEELTDKKEVLNKDLELLEEKNKNQYNKTDPDASVMVKPAHNLVAYNTQIAVDAKYKFIIETYVSTNGNDKQELHDMGSKVQTVLDKKEINLAGDTGYHSAKEIKKCIEDKITPYVPGPKPKNRDDEKVKYTKSQFSYDKENDSYICPNDQHVKRTTTVQNQNEKLNYVYRTSTATCKDCPLKNRCLPKKSNHKTICRWEHEEIIEQHTKDMQTDEAKEILKKRGSIVEHPFGTIKRNLGWDHYLVRGKEKVSGENALIMFGYNFKRLLNLIGIVLLMKLIINGKSEELMEEIAKYIANSWQNFIFFIFKEFNYRNYKNKLYY